VGAEAGARFAPVSGAATHRWACCEPLISAPVVGSTQILVSNLYMSWVWTVPSSLPTYEPGIPMSGSITMLSPTERNSYTVRPSISVSSTNSAGNAFLGTGSHHGYVIFWVPNGSLSV